MALILAPLFAGAPAYGGRSGDDLEDSSLPLCFSRGGSHGIECV
jgi:hypothetical protein